MPGLFGSGPKKGGDGVSGQEEGGSAPTEANATAPPPPRDSNDDMMDLHEYGGGDFDDFGTELESETESFMGGGDHHGGFEEDFGEYGYGDEDSVSGNSVMEDAPPASVANNQASNTLQAAGNNSAKPTGGLFGGLLGKKKAEEPENSATAEATRPPSQDQPASSTSKDQDKAAKTTDPTESLMNSGHEEAKQSQVLTRRTNEAAAADDEGRANIGATTKDAVAKEPEVTTQTSKTTAAPSHRLVEDSNRILTPPAAPAALENKNASTDSTGPNDTVADRILPMPTKNQTNNGNGRILPSALSAGRTSSPKPPKQASVPPKAAPGIKNASLPASPKPNSGANGATTSHHTHQRTFQQQNNTAINARPLMNTGRILPEGNSNLKQPSQQQAGMMALSKKPSGSNVTGGGGPNAAKPRAGTFNLEGPNRQSFAVRAPQGNSHGSVLPPALRQQHQQQQPSLQKQSFNPAPLQNRTPLTNRANNTTANTSVNRNNGTPRSSLRTAASEPFKRISPVPMAAQKPSASTSTSILPQEGQDGGSKNINEQQQKYHQDPKTPVATSKGQGAVNQHQRLSTTTNIGRVLPPNVTPGPATVRKAARPVTASNGGTTAPMDVSEDSADHDNDINMSTTVVNTPPTITSFDKNYTECIRNVRDIQDLQESNDSTLLELQVLFATAYAETQADRVNLTTFMAKLDAANAFMDTQMEEAKEFLGLFSSDGDTTTTD